MNSHKGAQALAAVTLALTALTSCSTFDQISAGAAPAASGSPTPRPTIRATAPSASAAAGTLTPPKIPGVTWRPAGSVIGGVPVTYLAQVDAGAIGLMWIDPVKVTFRLVPGLKVPEGSPVLPTDNTASSWVPAMVAAFNGGFMLKDAVGGYYYAHRTVRPLVTGLAAFEITADGRLSVGAWGRDLTLTPQTVTVRENLPLLVDDYLSRTSAADTAHTWGLANGGLWTANRSALGERADGSLVFAYGHEVRPDAMATALVSAGVRTAMVLDMNKSWPGGFVYTHSPAGIVGQRIQPQEYHSPSVYYARFTKDFVAVLRR